MQNSSSPNEDDNKPLDDAGKSIIALLPTEKSAHEAGLAILAAGCPYWVYPYKETFALVVRTSEASQLKHELRIYRLKNRFWPPISPALSEKSITSAPSYAFAGLLIVIFYLQGSYPQMDNLGMNNSADFWREGEYWRICTAVTLHADFGHLVGNLFGIVLFGHFSARYLGNGLAWTCIIATAALANMTNNLIHFSAPFFSLGASTAVFGALGLVTGFPVGSYFRTRDKITSRQWLVPLAGGLMLLAWLGSGNFPTDVAGHLWGFLWGLLCSAVLSFYCLHAKVSRWGQISLLAITWMTIAACWTLAFLNSN
jgi:membrane associated rhomboid family serine protease